MTNNSKPHVLYYQFILFIYFKKGEEGFKMFHEKGEEQG